MNSSGNRQSVNRVPAAPIVLAGEAMARGGVRVPMPWFKIAIAMVLGFASFCWADVDAVTKPSQDVTLAFVRPGQIKTIFVKEGQTVKEGEVLVEMDDTPERVEMQRLKLAAQDLTKHKAALEQLAQKKGDYAKIKDAFDHGSSTAQELEHADLDVKIGVLSVELAEFDHQQDIKKYEEAVAQLERMKLVSPINGKIEKILIKVGESANALANVIRVVNIDPVHVEIPVPLALGRAIKVGQQAVVDLAADATTPAQTRTCGQVTFVAAVADAASDTLMVRIEMCNSDHRPAGEHVKVNFPASTQPASAPAFATTQPTKE